MDILIYGQKKVPEKELGKEGVEKKPHGPVIEELKRLIEEAKKKGTEKPAVSPVSDIKEPEKVEIPKLGKEARKEIKVLTKEIVQKEEFDKLKSLLKEPEKWKIEFKTKEDHFKERISELEKEMEEAGKVVSEYMQAHTKMIQELDASDISIKVRGLKKELELVEEGIGIIKKMIPSKVKG